MLERSSPTWGESWLDTPLRLTGDTDEVVADSLPGAPAVVVQVPVRSLRRQHGTLVMASASRGWDADHGGALAALAFGEQAALAIGLTQARAEHERLALLEERDRIGRDLHDLVIQRLFATGMVLQGAQRLTSDPEVEERVGRAVRRARPDHPGGAQHDLRAAPRPARVVACAPRSCRRWPQARAPWASSPPCASTARSTARSRDDVREHVIAALREALSNAARHADATQVRVSLSVESDEVVLIVTDNGEGLPGVRGAPQRAGQPRQGRASASGGRFTIEPVPRRARRAAGYPGALASASGPGGRRRLTPGRRVARCTHSGAESDASNAWSAPLGRVLSARAPRGGRCRPPPACGAPSRAWRAARTRSSSRSSRRGAAGRRSGGWSGPHR